MRTSVSNKLFLCVAALAGGILGDTKVHAQPGGVPLWTNSFAYGLTGDATPVAVDRSGNVFVTGSANGAVTIKYSSMGGPLLAIARTTTNTLAVSWPSPAADFTLQQNTNVAPTNWMAVGTIPTDDGTKKMIIVDPPEGNRFYRLFRP